MGKHFYFVLFLTSCSALAEVGPSCPAGGSRTVSELQQFNCEANFRLRKCDQLFERFPELLESRRDCSKKEDWSNNVQDFLLGCSQGAVTATRDLIVGIVTLPVSIWSVPSKLSEAHEKARIDRDVVFKNCAENMGCKSFLINEVAKTPWSRNYFSGSPEEAKEYFRTINDPRNPELRKLMSMNSGYLNKYFDIPSFAQTEAKKAECFNRRDAQSLICYYLFQLVDPVAAAAMASKMAKLTRATKKMDEISGSELELKSTGTISATKTPDPLPPTDWDSLNRKFLERFNADLKAESLAFGQNGKLKITPAGQPNHILISEDLKSKIEQEVTIVHEVHHAKNTNVREISGTDKWNGVEFGKDAHILYDKGYYGEEISAFYAGGIRAEQIARKYRDLGDLRRQKEASQYAYLSYAQGSSFIKSTKPMVNEAIKQIESRGSAGYSLNANQTRATFNVLGRNGKPTTLSVQLRSGVAPNEAVSSALYRLRGRLEAFNDMYSRRIEYLRPK